MTDNRRKLITNPQGGMMKSFIKQIKLIGRLMGDSRVSPFVKILPIASLAYLISPVDLLPGVVFPVIGALDDAAIMWIGSTLFVQLCPDNVVKEHMDDLDMISGDADDIVDAESRDVHNK
ncbi:MAG TPA: YkvA family protein [Anaerolineales bacterium]|nr:YkvA family protein [Anaerolineales bacterium]